MKENNEETRMALAAVLLATSVVVSPVAASIFERHNQSLADRAASMEKDIKTNCMLPSPYAEMCRDIREREIKELEQVREELRKLSTPTPVR